MTKHQRLTPAPAPTSAPAAPALPEAALPAVDPDAAPADPLLPDDAIVPVAERADGWTADRQRAFIETLADTGCVLHAARSVGMSAQSAYRLRRRTDARAFDAAWDAALERSLERLIPVAIERALHGTVKKRWYHGEVVAEEHVVSERLLVWLLEKGATMLGHARARQAMRSDWDAALEGVGLPESTPPQPDQRYRIWIDERQEAYVTNAPPAPGYDGWTRGRPGDENFARHLWVEENEALGRRLDAPHISPWQDESRRRFFGLERIPAYVPEDADAWQAAMTAEVAAEMAGQTAGSIAGPGAPFMTDPSAEFPADGHAVPDSGPESSRRAAATLPAPGDQPRILSAPAHPAPPPAAPRPAPQPGPDQAPAAAPDAAASGQEALARLDDPDVDLDADALDAAITALAQLEAEVQEMEKWEAQLREGAATRAAPGRGRGR